MAILQSTGILRKPPSLDVGFPNCMIETATLNGTEPNFQGLAIDIRVYTLFCPIDE